MKITDVKFNSVESGNLLAFATVTFDDSVTVKGFRILEGDDGPFVGCPSEKGKDGKYYPTITFDKKTFKSSMETIKSFYDEFMEDEKPKRRKNKDDDEKPRRKRRDEDDDEDEKPKKKVRRDEDDEEDERPKKKNRRDEDDEEDEKPKKKKRRDEDDEDEEDDVDIWGKKKR